MRCSLLMVSVLLPQLVMAQQVPPPIIDMHLHASQVADFAALMGGRLPVPHCVPMTDYPIPESGARWMEVFGSANPPCTAIRSAMSDSALLARTLAIMERRNIIGLTSGPGLAAWVRAAPDRVIPSLGFAGGPESPAPDSLRAWFGAKRFAALGEVTIQYGGMEPDDSSMRRYWALAEELQVPVGIHIGTGPVGAPYVGPFSRYRARLHSPLLLEEVLVRHPKLRVFIMHAGWPMLDDLLAVLWAHPHVYVDVGVLDWALPRVEFHRYLQRIVEAGFGKRVMFGSDQMIWPEAVEMALQSIETAAFLTPEQKRDVLYNNAARFLRLTPQEIAKHHGR